MGAGLEAASVEGLEAGLGVGLEVDLEAGSEAGSTGLDLVAAMAIGLEVEAPALVAGVGGLEAGLAAAARPAQACTCGLFAARLDRGGAC